MTRPIQFPRPLRTGDRIGITGPSSGVPARLHARLDHVLGHLRVQGFAPEEGICLRSRHKHVSAPARERAAELERFWHDESVRAIMPPWGGELLVEILPLLDWERLARSGPKWVTGFSDLSTLHFALTTRLGFATLHSANLMDLSATQTDALTAALVPVLRSGPGASFEQQSSPQWQGKWGDFEKDPTCPFLLSEPTRWRPLGGESEVRFGGRLIGGCLDTIARLIGTPYGDLPAFRREFAPEGVVFYFENCELAPCELARTLWQARLAGWFEGVNGMLIGRSSAPEVTDPANLSYEEALRSVLADLPFPVLLDTDIGHRPPQLNLVNGALAELSFDGSAGSLKQTLR